MYRSDGSAENEPGMETALTKKETLCAVVSITPRLMGSGHPRFRAKGGHTAVGAG